MTSLINCGVDNPIITQPLIETSDVCQQPAAAIFETKMIADICTPHTVLIPIQIELVMYIVYIIETNYWTDGITAWPTSSYNTACRGNECFDAIKTYPNGGKGPTYTGLQAFGGSVLGKIQRGTVKRVPSVMVLKSTLTSYEKGRWISEFDNDFFANWSPVQVGSELLYVKNYKDHTNVAKDPSLMINKDCNSCLNPNCADEKILKCVTTGKLGYSAHLTKDEVNDGSLNLSNLTDGITIYLFSYSTSEFLYSRNTDYQISHETDCTGSKITIISKGSAKWYTKDHMVKSRRVKREQTGIDQIFGEMSSLDTKVIKAFNLLLSTTHSAEDKLTLVIQGLSNAIDRNFQMVAETLTYNSCLERKRNSGLARTLSIKDPKLSLMLLNNSIDSAAVTIVEAAETHITYKDCNYIKAECDIFNPVDLITSGFCKSLKCKSSSGESFYQINGLIYKNEVVMTCEQGTFWLSNDRKFTINNLGQIVTTQINQIASNLIDVSQNIVSLRDNVNTLKASEAYMGMQAAHEQAQKAIEDALGTEAGNLFSEFSSFFNGPWAGLTTGITQVVLGIIVALIVISMCVGCCCKFGTK